jgi:hypothetical protein
MPTLKQTAKRLLATITSVLSMSVLLSAIIAGSIALVAHVARGSDCVGDGSSYIRAVLCICAEFSAGLLVAYGLALLQNTVALDGTHLGRQEIRRSVFGLAALTVLAAFPSVAWAIWWQLGGDPGHLKSYMVSATCAVAMASVFVATGMLMVKYFDAMPLAESASHAGARLAGALPIASRKRSMWSVMTQVAKVGLPGLVIVAMLVCYIFAVFIAYRHAQPTWLKTIVYFVALGIKTAGKKAMLLLLATLPAAVNRQVVDQYLFCYEFAASLLCRILILSMPDQQAAFIISLATNGLELMSRDFFYARYVGIGLRCQSDHDRAAWSARGYWRVVDSNNTMVIEYVTTTVGAAILYLLPQLGVFVIATNVAESAVSVDRLVGMMAIQLIPEVVVDVYGIIIDSMGGLGERHIEYWVHMRGLSESLPIKAGFGVWITALVLTTCLQFQGAASDPSALASATLAPSAAPSPS